MGEFHRLKATSAEAVLPGFPRLRIDCCISMGVHYCDISGEIPWSRRITPLNTYAQRNKAGTLCPGEMLQSGWFPHN